jgi:hypothetical protein
MAKVQSLQQKKRPARQAATRNIDLPQGVNYIILCAGVAVILLGYVVMSMGDATSSLSMTVAPIILMLGYCVIIPYGIIHRKKSDNEQNIR